MARAARSGSRLDTGLLIACSLLALFATVLPMPVREAIASSLRRTVVAPLLGLQERAVRARNAFVERDAVMARLDSMALRNAALRELEAENIHLRGLLALGRRLRWGFVPSEALHGDDEVITLTVGSRAGIRSGAPVVAPDGLVGKVTTVDAGSSLAIMWTHRDFRASAMATDGSAFGIVRAHLVDDAQSANGEPSAERYLLELRGVQLRDTLKAGTPIATSGLGGVFPRGIPIGTVLGEIRTNEQWSRTYLVRPAVRPQDVTNVMILSPELMTDSLDAAWQTTASAEEMTRAIAAAGDSLARRATFDSLAAAEARRRAAEAAVGDSTPPDSGAVVPPTTPAAAPSTRPASSGAAPVAPRPPNAVRRDSSARRP